MAGFEPAASCSQIRFRGSPDSAGCRPVCRSPVTTAAERRRAWAGTWRRWLPRWLPAISLAWLMFDSSNKLTNPSCPGFLTSSLQSTICQTASILLTVIAIRCFRDAVMFSVTGPAVRDRPADHLTCRLLRPGASLRTILAPCAISADRRSSFCLPERRRCRAGQGDLCAFAPG